MPSLLRIALVGDYDPNKLAHVCIPKALEISAASLGTVIEPIWLETLNLGKIENKDLEEFDGIWCVPGAPYKNRNSVLRVIEHARAVQIPYLGTCGGCQHAVLEFAINELGIKNAGLEEEEPGVEVPLISSLPCRLTDESQKITLMANSKIGRAYQQTEISEEYRCGFGINPKFLSLFSDSDLKFVAFSEEMIPQAVELTNHPFFVGTAFQPERSSHSGKNHPLIQAFVNAAMARSLKE
jgi:CTP synthase (UTP-ammonia lyase)